MASLTPTKIYKITLNKPGYAESSILSPTHFSGYFNSKYSSENISKVEQQGAITPSTIENSNILAIYRGLNRVKNEIPEDVSHAHLKLEHNVDCLVIVCEELFSKYQKLTVTNTKTKESIDLYRMGIPDIVVEANTFRSFRSAEGILPLGEEEIELEINCYERSTEEFMILGNEYTYPEDSGIGFTESSCEIKHNTIYFSLFNDPNKIVGNEYKVGFKVFLHDRMFLDEKLNVRFWMSTMLSGDIYKVSDINDFLLSRRYVLINKNISIESYDVCDFNSGAFLDEHPLVSLNVGFKNNLANNIDFSNPDNEFLKGYFRNILSNSIVYFLEQPENVSQDNPISMSMVNRALNKDETAYITLNDPDVRKMANRNVGTISLNDLRGGVGEFRCDFGIDIMLKSDIFLIPVLKVNLPDYNTNYTFKITWCLSKYITSTGSDTENKFVTKTYIANSTNLIDNPEFNKSSIYRKLFLLDPVESVNYVWPSNESTVEPWIKSFLPMYAKVDVFENGIKRYTKTINRFKKLNHNGTVKYLTDVFSHLEYMELAKTMMITSLMAGYNASITFNIDYWADIIKKSFMNELQFYATSGDVDFSSVFKLQYDSELRNFLPVDSGVGKSLYKTLYDQPTFIPRNGYSGIRVSMLPSDNDIITDSSRTIAFSSEVKPILPLMPNYTFSSFAEAKAQINQILASHNNDLSGVCIRFDSSVDSIAGLFKSTAITKAPSIVGRTDMDMSNLFENCTSFVDIADLFPSYHECKIDYMFKGCTSLSKIKDLGRASSLVGTFQGCTSLRSISRDFRIYPEATNAAHIFEGSGIQLLPKETFEYAENITNLDYICANCESLIEVEEGAFKRTFRANSFDHTFAECTNLRTIPQVPFPSITLLQTPTNMDATFKNCSSLTSDVQDIWTIPETSSHVDYASGCVKAANYTSIPAEYGGPLYHRVDFVLGQNVHPIEYLTVLDGETISEPESIITYNNYIVDGYFTDLSLQQPFDFATPIKNNLTLYTKLSVYSDYFFYDRTDFDTRIDGILAENNYNLEGKIFLFGDGFKDLSNGFKNKNLITAPIMIGPNLQNISGCFEGTGLTKIDPLMLSGCPNLNNFTNTFKDLSSLTGDAVDFWNKYPEAIGTDCYINCDNLNNYKDVPGDWGGFYNVTILGKDKETVKTLPVKRNTKINEDELKPHATYYEGWQFLFFTSQFPITVSSDLTIETMYSRWLSAKLTIGHKNDWSRKYYGLDDYGRIDNRVTVSIPDLNLSKVYCTERIDTDYDDLGFYVEFNNGGLSTNKIKTMMNGNGNIEVISARNGNSYPVSKDDSRYDSILSFMKNNVDNTVDFDIQFDYVDAKVVTVNFIGNEFMESVASVKIVSGYPIAEPNVHVTEDGYSFLGWYTDPEFKNKFNFSTPITENTTLYANVDSKPCKVTFIANDTQEVIKVFTAKSGKNFRLNIMDTESDSEFFLPVDKFGGPIGLLIDDGETSPKGDKKWIFDRVINEDTTVEVEMLRFDYYFETGDDFKKQGPSILTTHKNDLSSISIGLSDSVTRLINCIPFQYSDIAKTPKYFYCRNNTNLESLFGWCAQLRNISDTIFDNCPKITDFDSIFYRCSVLASIPEGLFKNNTKAANLGHAFYRCTSVRSIPAGLFDNCPEITDFSYTFAECSNITSMPEGLFVKNTKITDFTKAFYKCIALGSIPNGLFDNCLEVTKFTGAFYGCSLLTSIPTGLFSNCPEITDFSFAFYACSKITSIPERLFDNNAKVTNFSYTFYNCSSVTSNVPDAWNKSKHPNVTSYSKYAYGCSKALNYIDVPQDWGGPVVHTVTFNVGEHANPVDPIRVISGNTIQEPSLTITTPDYVLIGWYKDQEFTQEFTFNTPITGDLTLYANIGIKRYTVTFVASDDKSELLTVNVVEGNEYRLSVMNTATDRSDFIPIVQKSDGYYYGPKQFLIPDGELDPKGVNKWIFNRVINEDTAVEVEMMKFDYYFENANDYETKAPSIATAHNNDLSSISLGFSDSIASLEYYTPFQYSDIAKTPKYFYCRNNTNLESLFGWCAQLRNISDTIFDNCPKVTDFSYTFSDCYSLTSIPENLFKNNTEVTDFSFAFANCYSITSIPVGLFDNCPKVTNFSFAFSSCTSLTSMPEGLFDNCPEVTNFSYTFDNCTSLTSIPVGLFDNCPEVTDFSYTFDNCTSLTSIPVGLFDNCPKVTDFSFAFSSCTSITSIPVGLFDNCPKVTNFSFAFSSCTSLTSMPEGLFDNCPKVTDFSYTFDNCTSLTSNVPDAWNKSKHPNVTSYSNYAYSCTKAANYASIPSSWK